MRSARGRTTLLALAASAAVACSPPTPDPAPSPPPATTLAPPTPRPRAALPQQPLDALVAGRTLRDWVERTERKDPFSPEAADARRALRAVPQETADAIHAWLRASDAPLPDVLWWLLPDVRDACVPALLEVIDADGTGSETAARLLEEYSGCGGFGRNDAAVVAWLLARRARGAPPIGVWLLTNLGAAAAPYAAAETTPDPWDHGDAPFVTGWPVAPEVAAAAFPLADAAERPFTGDRADWARHHATQLGPAVGALVTRLGHTADPFERLAILRTLAYSGTETGARALLAAAAGTTDPEEIDILGRCRDAADRALPILRAVRSGTDPVAGDSAWTAIVRLAGTSDAMYDELRRGLLTADPVTARVLEDCLRRVVSDWDRWLDARPDESPLLPRLLRDPDPSLRTLGVGLVEIDGPQRPLLADVATTDPDPAVRALARERLVPAPHPTPVDVGDWLRELDRSGRDGFDATLRRFREQGGSVADLVGAARRLLDSGSDSRAAAYTLAIHLGPEVAELAPSIRPRLESNSHGLDRPGAAAALLAIEGAAAAPTLRDSLVRFSFRDEFVEGLTQLPASSLPILLVVLRDEDPRLRRAAALTLGELDGDRDTTAAALSRALTDPDDQVRLAAAASLLRLRTDVDRALAQAVRDLDVWSFGDGAEDTCGMAAVPLLEALAAQGAAAAPAVDALRRGLRTPALDQRAAVRICQALAAMGTAAAPAIPELVACASGCAYGLGEDVWSFSESMGPIEWAPLAAAASDALGAIGPAAKDAVPILRRAAVAPDPRLRAAATAAIRRIEGR